MLDHPVPRPLAGDGQPIQLAREADREVAHIDHFLDLAFPLGADLAGLEGDQKAQVGLACTQGRTDLADDLAAARRGNQTPGPKRLARTFDDALVICGRRRAYQRQTTTGRGICRLDRDVARAVNTVAAANAPIELADSQPAQKVFKHDGSTNLLNKTANGHPLI